MTRAEEIAGVKYSEMNEKQKKVYHNTLRKESQKRNPDKVKQQNREYRKKKNQQISQLQAELKKTRRLLNWQLTICLKN